MEETIKIIVEKITLLRLEKGLSERQLSLNLGHSPSYINGITTGKKLPSLNEFLYMLEYFNISPSDFFDLSTSTSPKQLTLLNLSKNLLEDDLDLLIDVATRLNKNNPCK